MRFFAKLLALIVILTFAGAIYFQVEGVVDKIEKPEKKVETEVAVESFELQNVNLPTDFESLERTLAGLQTVKVADLDEMRKRIYLEGEVLVYIENSHLKNPFLGVNDKLLISLVGFTGEHLVSSGRELGQGRFIYLAEDFMVAWKLSGGKAWVLN